MSKSMLQMHIPLDHIEEHLTSLIKLSNGWIRTIKMNKQTYMKIKKEQDVNTILNIVRDKQKELVHR